MKDMLFLASCPICGRSLFKGRPNSYIEMGCPKCKSFLQIFFTEEGIKAEVYKAQVENTKNKIAEEKC